MAEYIEREAVEKMLENAQIISDGEYCGYCTEDVDISKIPAADVVEVVRCKDCKHSKYRKSPFGELTFTCELLCADIKPVDFCSYGERRDNHVE